MDKSSRIQELSDLITRARHDYYNGTPKTADEVFDAWRDELAELEADNPAVTAVGAPPVSAWPKVSHCIPMGSLNKVNTLDEILVWIKGVTRADQRYEPLMVSEKLDGISIHVRYEKGKLVQALTRGDGSLGEDITVNVLKMQGIQAKLPERFTGSLRGEIVLHRDVLAAKFPDKTSARNTAAGTSKRFDGEGCQHLNVYFYRIADGLELPSISEMFEKLAAWGLKTPNWFLTAMTPGIKTPQDLWMEYQQGKRDALLYDIDGLVVEVNDLAHQLTLGEESNCPKGAVAYKFAPITRETILRKIEWQVGSIGRITPVAVFDSVHLIGANVTNASLYNQRYIQDLKLDIGAKILVARANDVIPRVVSVISGTGSVAMPPATCPSCGEPTTWEGEYLVCANKSGCAAHAAGRIKQWIGEQGILEWGDTLIEKLVSSGLVNNVADLYRLTQEQVERLDRMGPRSAEVVLASLNASKEFPLERFLGGLSIPNCATSTIRFAMDAGLDTLEKIRTASPSDLMQVDGFGQVKADALASWLKANAAMVDDLLTVIRVKGKIEGALTGKSVCFTGAMKRKRAELETLVVNSGGVVKSSVGKGLTFLVISDPNSTSSKATAARKHGTRCISEEEFLTMVSA
jgi:DNA ligase (NAD+)